jgi:hypothetical protein
MQNLTPETLQVIDDGPPRPAADEALGLFAGSVIGASSGLLIYLKHNQSWLNYQFNVSSLKQNIADTRYYMHHDPKSEVIADRRIIRQDYRQRRALIAHPPQHHTSPSATELASWGGGLGGVLCAALVTACRLAAYRRKINKIAASFINNFELERNYYIEESALDGDGGADGGPIV